MSQLDNYPPGYGGELDDFLDPIEEVAEFDDSDNYRENLNEITDKNHIEEEIPLHDEF